MYRFTFKKTVIKKYLQNIENKLSLSSENLAKKVGISGRTLRDWKNSKFKPNSEIIKKLSILSGVSIPPHRILSKNWHVKKAAKLGGKKRYKIYGEFGNKKTRSKGGRISWLNRKNNPKLLRKYMNIFLEPKETANLAEFVGILLGDGGITKDQVTIYVNSQTEQNYAQYIKKLSNKLFKANPSIYKVRNMNMIRITISGINIVKYLISKGLKIGNKVHLQVGVPNWIRRKEIYIKRCIRGLIDTDGCFTWHQYTVNDRDYSYLKISFSNRSEPLLEFVFESLKMLGFNPKRTSKYNVWLYNQSEVKRYLQKIGTKNIKPAISKIMESGPDGKAQVC